MAQRMPRPITREEWRVLAGDRGLSEWVDGEVVTFMPPRTVHQELIAWLVQVIGLFVRMAELGRVIPAPYEMRLPRSSREPDLVFVARANEGRIGPARLDGPADLVVEVVSDDSVARDQLEKRREYEAAGVQEYWIMDPREGKRTFLALARGDDGRFVAIEPDPQGHVHSVVIPGLWVDPAWLWQEPRPQPVRIIGAIAPDLLRTMLDG